MSILGVWMWPKNVRVYGAEKVVAQCARARVTDIYFLTKGLAGTTAYCSSLAPSEERDLLRELLDAAHARSIRVHAWFTSASDEHYKELHPESGRCHFSKGKNNGLIALADKDYLTYMEKITQELCRGYDIDGLHLDYIRYNHLLYGWSEEDMARYAAQGADVAHLKSLMQRMFYAENKEETLLFDAFRSGDESVHALARTRRQDVMHFARTLTSLARAEKSSLILSAALMPEGAYDDVAFSDVHYGQNYEDAAKLYDFALPMAYSKAYDQDAAWVRRVAEGTMRRGMKTIVGVHAYEGGTGVSLQEDIAGLEGSGVEGVCLFREGATAFAYARDKELCVYNALEATISGVTVLNCDETISLAAEIAPGQEQRFTLPCPVKRLRAYTGDKEVSIYLTEE